MVFLCVLSFLSILLLNLSHFILDFRIFTVSFFAVSHNNPFLRRLVDCQSGDGKMSKEMKKERKETCLARYYERVMRLFEEVSAPRYVILVAQEATRLLRSNDSKSVSTPG